MTPQRPQSPFQWLNLQFHNFIFIRTSLIARLNTIEVPQSPLKPRKVKKISLDEIFSAGHMLILAAQCGNADEVNSLISVHQVDVNYRSLSTGQTALMHARNAKVADMLLRNGAGKLKVIFKIISKK